MMKSAKGDCDCCPQTDVDLVLVQPGNMMMCKECRQKQTDSVKSASQTIQESRKVDESIETKTDIFITKTVPAIELYAAIEHDDTILPEKKWNVFTDECYNRWKKLSQEIFEDKARLIAKETEARMWQANAQTAAGKLHESERAKYAELDINYGTRPVKSTKPAKDKPVTTNAAKQAKEAREAIEKYNLKGILKASVLQQFVVARGKSADEIAREYAAAIS